MYEVINIKHCVTVVFKHLMRETDCTYKIQLQCGLGLTGMVMNTCESNTWEVEAGGSQTSLRSCFKKPWGICVGRGTWVCFWLFFEVGSHTVWMAEAVTVLPQPRVLGR